MKRRVAGAVALGVVGTSVLVALCVWQIGRLQWKEGLIASLEARFAAAPVAVPADPDPVRDAFLHVKAEGTVGGREIRMLTSHPDHGPGFRVIAPMALSDGRKVLVDLGFVPEAERDAARPPVTGEVTGSLYWPDEKDMFTPDPDLGANIWFARDLGPMAELLGTESLLIVADATPMAPWPMPLRIGVNVPNNHLQYAITWGLLALAWAVMSVILVRGQRAAAPRRKVGD